MTNLRLQHHLLEENDVRDAADQVNSIIYTFPVLA